MRFSTAIVIGAAAMVGAQDLSGLPPCALTCFLTAAESTGCNPITDVACQCSAANQAKIIASAGPCIEAACSGADLAKASAAGNALCASATGAASAPASTAASAVSSSISSIISSVSSSAAASSSMAASSSEMMTSTSTYTSTVQVVSTVTKASSSAAMATSAPMTSSLMMGPGPVVISSTKAPASMTTSAVVATYTGAAVQNAINGFAGVAAAVAAFVL